jgi:hypothetical protein
MLLSKLISFIAIFFFIAVPILVISALSRAFFKRSK